VIGRNEANITAGTLQTEKFLDGGMSAHHFDPPEGGVPNSCLRDWKPSQTNQRGIRLLVPRRKKIFAGRQQAVVEGKIFNNSKVCPHPR
jgi:hypothetical protein